MAGIRVPVRLRTLEAYIATRHGRPRQLTAAEADVLASYADQIVLDVVNRWPRDTGQSGDAFSYVLHSQPDGLGFEIINDIDYSEFVHHAGAPSDPPLWRTLIPAVVRAYAPDIDRDMRQAVDRTEAKLRRRPGNLLNLVSQALGRAPRPEPNPRIPGVL